jgi:hypothetical protein
MFFGKSNKSLGKLSGVGCWMLDAGYWLLVTGCLEFIGV